MHTHTDTCMHIHIPDHTHLHVHMFRQRHTYTYQQPEKWVLHQYYDSGVSYTTGSSLGSIHFVWRLLDDAAWESITTGNLECELNHLYQSTIPGQ